MTRMPPRLESFIERAEGCLGLEQAQPPPESAKPSFTPDTIVHIHMPEGGRGLVDYETHLYFDRSELQGMRVLDLGSGPEVKFARELQAAGVTALVVSMSPDYTSPDHGSKAAMLHNGPLLAGIGEGLPFRDNSFDYVFGLHTHYHAHNRIKLIREAIRVLDYGGVAKIAPDIERQIFNRFSLNSGERQYLADQGVHLTLEEWPIPGEVGPRAAVFRKSLLAGPLLPVEVDVKHEVQA